MKPLLYMVMLMLAGTVQAVHISMDIQPRALTLGETTTLTLSVEGADQQGSPDLPLLDGLNVVGRSRGDNFTFDGHTQRRTRNYSFVLQPTRAGTIRVGPFSYELAGEHFDLPAIDLQVLAPGATAEGGTAGDRPLFATLVAQPTNVYHQQTFDLVLTIYSRGLNLDQQVAADFPSEGLKVEQLRELRCSQRQTQGSAPRMQRLHQSGGRRGKCVCHGVVAASAVAERGAAAAKP